MERNSFRRDAAIIFLSALGLLIASGCPKSHRADREAKAPVARVRSPTDPMNPVPIGKYRAPGALYVPVDQDVPVAQDCAWARLLVDYAVGADTPEKKKAVLHKLKEIREALKVVQFERDGYDYRLTLNLSQDHETELLAALSSKFQIESIRHTPWNFRDGFVDSLTLLVENAPAIDTTREAH